jgi:RNA polymerase sigma factor (sigma-70 family)
VGVGISTLGSATSVPHARELLAEFKATGDQHAFEEIVRRYAGMVFGVCLRTTKNSHDAEDATQAVFLSLAAQCKTGDGVRYVGPWLQQVAKRVSLDIKRSRKRRETREHRHHQMNGNGNGHTAVEKSGAVDVDELKGVLGEELSQLPAKYRLPLILHYFGGLSRDEMAKELGCKPATLGVRIHRGREMLGRRLHERGAAPQGLTLSALLTGSIQSGVSDALVARTCEAVARMSLGQDLGTMISAQVLAISKTAAAGAALAVKLKAMAAVLLVACLTAAAAGGAVAKLAPGDLQWRNPFNWNWLPAFRAPLPKLRLTDARPAGPDTPARPDENAATEQPAVRVVEALPPGAPAAAPPTAVAQRPAAPAGPPAAGGPDGGALARAAGDAGPAGTAAPGRAPAGPTPPPDDPRSVASAAADVIVNAWRRMDLPSLAEIAGRQPQATSFPPGQFAVGDVRAGTVNAMRPIVPGAGRAPVAAPDASALSVGAAPGSAGRFSLNGGSMSYDVQDIGAAGHGSFDQVGGTNTATQLSLGRDYGGFGQYTLRGGGYLRVRRGGPGAAGVLVGGGGDGRLNLGDAHSTGNIHDVGGGPGEPPSLVLRGDAAGTGVIEGAGTVNLPGTLLNNGTAIADGHGQGRTLDFYGFGRVTNSIENPPVGGTQGWYAKAGGRLALPPIRVAAGTATYTWGEDAADAVLDLVNSARVTLHDAPSDGSLEISLLALDRGGVPPLPKGHTFIGIWQADLVAHGRDPLTGAVTSDPMAPGSMGLTVRYDDALAARLGLDENQLKLWKYADGKWTRILDGFERHPDLNILTGHTNGGLGYFAVSAPEPGAGAILLLTGGYLLTRRRRRQG